MVAFDVQGYDMAAPVVVLNFVLEDIPRVMFDEQDIEYDVEVIAAVLVLAKDIRKVMFHERDIDNDTFESASMAVLAAAAAEEGIQRPPVKYDGCCN